MRGRLFGFLFLVLSINLRSQVCGSLLCNGDFDTPTYSPAQWSVWILNSQSPCWKTDATDNQMEIWTIGNNDNTLPYNGNQFIEINAMMIAFLYQDFNAVSGIPLTIGFAHMGRLGVDSMRIGIGPAGGPYTIIGQKGDGQSWGYHTLPYTPTTTGVYRLWFYSIYTSLNGYGPSASGNFLDAVSVVPTYVVPLAAASVSVCQGKTATLTASGATNYTWSTGSNNASISASPAAVTVYTVTGKVSSCSKTNTVAIYVNALPPVALLQPTLAACPGITSTLTALGGVSYTWIPGGPVSNTRTAAPLVSTVYSVTASSALGCTATASSTLSVKVLPTLNFTTAVVTCTGLGSSTVAASGGTGPNTYTWAPTLQTGSTAVNLSAANYTVTTRDVGSTCFTSSITSLAPLSPFTGSLSATGNLNCYAVNTGTAAFVGLTGALGSLSYTWTNGVTSYATPSVNTLSAGSWTATVRDQVTACQVFSVFVVTQPPGILLGVSVSSPSMCSGNSATLTAFGATTYSWNTGSTNFSIAVTPGITTGYTVSGTTSACTVTSAITLTVRPTPTLTIPQPGYTLCPLTGTLLTVSGAPAYTWMPGNFAGPIYTITPLVTTLYTVTGVSLFGCTATTVCNVVLQPAPVLGFTNTAITCTAMGSSKVLATGTPGLFSYTWTPTLQTGTLATNLSATTYTVRTLDAGTGCFTSSTTAILPLTPFTADLNATTILTCNSVNTGTAAFNNMVGNSAGVSYTWTNGFISYSTPSMSALSAGSWTAIVKDNVSACHVFSVFVITQATPLTIGLSASSPTICAGNSTTLVASGASSYTWNTSSNNATISVTPASTTNFTVAGTIGVCIITNIITVTVQSTFSINVSQPSLYNCPASTTVLNVSGALSYTWEPGTFSGSAYTVAPVANTVYTVTGSSAFGCKAMTTCTVFVKPVPDLAFSSTAITCTSLATSTIVPTGGTGPFSYTWMPANQTGSIATNLNPVTHTLIAFDIGTGCSTASTTSIAALVPFTASLSATNSLTCNAVNTGTSTFINFAGGSTNHTYTWTNGTLSYFTPSVNALNAASWTATVRDALTACNVYSVFVITQPPALTINFSSPTPSTCAGTGISLPALANGGTPAYTYTWMQGSQQHVQPLNNAVATASQNLPGTYVYTLTVRDSYLCTQQETISVAFVPNPTISVVNSSVCPLQTGSVTLTGATSYTIVNIASGVVTVLNSPASIFSDLPGHPNIYNGAVYPYLLTGSSQGCTTAATASITVKPTPTLSISQNTLFVCNTQKFSFQASPAATYAWSGPNNYLSYGQGDVLTNVQVAQAGNYRVIISAVNSCTNAAFITLAVYPTPTLSATGSTVCTNQTLNFSATHIAGASYQWSGPSGFSSNQQTISIANPVDSQSGNYSVLCTSALGCSATASAQVLVFPTPSAVILTVKNKLCEGDFVVLEGSSNLLSNNNYAWTGPNSYSAKGQSVTLSAFSNAYAGNYTLTVNNKYNCKSSVSKTLSVYRLPSISLGTTNASGCAPYCANLVFVQKTGEATVTDVDWRMDGTAIAGNNFIHCFYKSGTYTITGTVKDTNSCSNVLTTEVNVYPLPRAEFGFYPQQAIAGLEEIHFTNESAGEQLKQWQWRFSDDAGYNSTDKSTSYLFKNAGRYVIAMKVTNTWGCEDTIIKPIVVEPNLSAYVPNAFTPNGDTKNDLFYPCVPAVDEMRFEIFDRWGKKIFSANSAGPGWDGTFGGEACKEDIYIWKLHLQIYSESHSQKFKDLSGEVTLIR